MPNENENLISNEIRLYMLNPILYPTIQGALQYIDENFEGTEFEKGREMGYAYAERAPYWEIKPYEEYLPLLDKLQDGWGDSFEAGFRRGVLEYIKNEIECVDIIMEEEKDASVEKQLENFQDDLCVISILDSAGLIEQPQPSETPKIEEEKPVEIIKLKQSRRMIRLD